MAGVSRAICIPNSAATPARELMDEWLAARGFEPHDGKPAWPCDDGLERCYFLFTNEWWSILLYSGIDGRLEEDNRLLMHLARGGEPLLYVWDLAGMWGYRIHDGREVLDAYVANYNGAPEWVKEDHPCHGDLKYLCETFALPARPRTLDQIRKSRVIARHDVAARFCDELGVAPAAVAYGDAEWRFLNEAADGTFGGFRVERGYYVKRGFRPHASSLRIDQVPTRVDKAGAAWWPGMSFEIDENYLRAMRRLIALIAAVLTPIAWVLRTLFRTAAWVDALYRRMGWDQPSRHRGAFERELFAGAHASFVVGDGGALRNGLRCVEITMPADAKPLPHECRGAFLFSLGKVRIECDAIRPEADGHVRALFRAPAGFSIAGDESTVAGGFPVRALVWQRDNKDEKESAAGTFVARWIVQTPEAFYDFHCVTDSRELQEKVRTAMRDVLASFRRTSATRAVTGATADTSGAAAAAPTA